MSLWTKFRNVAAGSPAVTDCAFASHSHGEPHPKSLAELHDAASPIVLDAGERLFDHVPALPALYGITHGSCTVSTHLGDQTVQCLLPTGTWIGLLPPHSGGGLTYTLYAETQATLITLDVDTLQRCPAPLQLQIRSALQDTWIQLWQNLATTATEATHAIAHLTAQLHHVTATQQATAQTEVIQQAIAQLPKLPASTQQLLAHIQDEQASIHRLTTCIQQDPTLAGMILKHVNSATFGLSRPISSIQHAIAYLGRNHIYQIALQDLVHGLLPSHAAFRTVQQHSAVIALLAHELAAHAPIAKGSNPLTLGILHDLGEVVLLSLKDTYATTSALVDNLDTAALGAELLRHWHVPEPICRVIAQQHLPEFCPPPQLPPEDRTALALLYLAHAYEAYLTDTPGIPLTYLEAYSRELQLTPSGAHAFYCEVILPALRKNPYKLPEAFRTCLTS